MQLHQIKIKNTKRKKKRIGRGGKRGTYSGRGVKGQKSRAGAKFKPLVRDLIKPYPKLKGYRKQSVQKLKHKRKAINLSLLEEKFDNNGEVTPQTLMQKGLISKIKGKMPAVKILARGKLTKKLIFKNCLVSQSARKMIEKAGGIIEKP